MNHAANRTGIPYSGGANWQGAGRATHEKGLARAGVVRAMFGLTPALPLTQGLHTEVLAASWKVTPSRRQRMNYPAMGVAGASR